MTQNKGGFWPKLTKGTTVSSRSPLRFLPKRRSNKKLEKGGAGSERWKPFGVARRKGCENKRGRDGRVVERELGETRFPTPPLLPPGAKPLSKRRRMDKHRPTELCSTTTPLSSSSEEEGGLRGDYSFPEAKHKPDAEEEEKEKETSPSLRMFQSVISSFSRGKGGRRIFRDKHGGLQKLEVQLSACQSGTGAPLGQVTRESANTSKEKTKNPHGKKLEVPALSFSFFSSC